MRLLIRAMLPCLWFAMSMSQCGTSSRCDAAPAAVLMQTLGRVALRLGGGSKDATDGQKRRYGGEAWTQLGQEGVGSKRAREAYACNASECKRLVAVKDENMEGDIFFRVSSSSEQDLPTGQQDFYHDPFDDQLKANIDAQECISFMANISGEKQTQTWKKRSRIKASDDCPLTDHNPPDAALHDDSNSCLSDDVNSSEPPTPSASDFSLGDERELVEEEDEEGRLRNVTRVKIGNLKDLREFGDLDSDEVYNEHNSSFLLVQGGWTSGNLHVPCVKRKGAGRTGLPTWTGLQEVLDRAIARGRQADAVKIILHRGEHLCRKDIVVWPCRRVKIHVLGEDARVIGRWILREESGGLFSCVTFVSIESLLNSFKPCVMLVLGGGRAEGEEGRLKWTFSLCSLLSGLGDSLVCVGSPGGEQAENGELPSLLLSSCSLGGIDERQLRCGDCAFVKGNVKCNMLACCLQYSGHCNGSAIYSSQRAHVVLSDCVLQENFCSLSLYSGSRAVAANCEFGRAERQLAVDPSSSLHLEHCSLLVKDVSALKCPEGSFTERGTRVEIEGARAAETGATGSGGGGGAAAAAGWFDESRAADDVRLEGRRNNLFSAAGDGNCCVAVGSSIDAEGEGKESAICCACAPPCPHARLDELIRLLLPSIPARQRTPFQQAVDDFTSNPPRISEEAFAEHLCRLARAHKQPLVAPLQSLFASFFFHSS